MHAIEELEKSYALFSLGVGEIQPCIDWAIERLQLNQEGDDLKIVLLASATVQDEALPLVKEIVRQYKGSESMNLELVAGKYVSALYPLYLSGSVTIASLDAIFGKLYSVLNYPNWLVMLSRNCEYATDIDNFLVPFDKEFEYIASLWSKAGTLNEFEGMYSREESNKHDIKYC